MATNVRTVEAAPEQDAMGRPVHQRRVSDRLLAAHNYAYATGSRRLAEELRDILGLIERDERATYDRRGIDAVERAQRWVALVDARDPRLRFLCSTDDVDEAVALMVAAREKHG